MTKDLEILLNDKRFIRQIYNFGEVKKLVNEARDEVIRQFATGEFIKTDLAKKFLREGIKDILPKETDNNYWMKKLKVPSSDYSYGHMHGFNECLKQINNRIKV
jgi:hypothetical protein